MLGMFLAVVNQAIIAPAMLRIVVELRGMEHYSWIGVRDGAALGVRSSTAVRRDRVYRRSPSP
jgi:hypothetical protein